MSASALRLSSSRLLESRLLPNRYKYDNDPQSKMLRQSSRFENSSAAREENTRPREPPNKRFIHEYPRYDTVQLQSLRLHNSSTQPSVTLSSQFGSKVRIEAVCKIGSTRRNPEANVVQPRKRARGGKTLSTRPVRTLSSPK